MKTYRIASKCMKCYLHFNVYSYSENRHSESTLYCPECGQHDGFFLVEVFEEERPIYEFVPGKIN